MSYQYLLEIDVGYQLKRWKAFGAPQVHVHDFTDIAPINVYIDGTKYNEALTLAACQAGTGETWYPDRGSAIYIHDPIGTPGTRTAIKVESTLHFSRGGVMINKKLGTGGTAYPVFYEGRMNSIPSLSYISNVDAMGGGMIPQIGQISLLNNDGIFDSMLTNRLWKNQPARLYVSGTSGTTGTLPTNYLLKQSFTVDSPSISRTSLTLNTNSDIAKLQVPINEGSTITFLSGNVSITKPAPVVMGMMYGVPAYYTGRSGSVGTYVISAHRLYEVIQVWNQGGTLGTIQGDMAWEGKVAAYPVSEMGKKIIYVAGTGLMDIVGLPVRFPGDAMLYLLGSSAKIGTLNINVADFTTVDSERPMYISAWFGRNETIQEGLDAISRTAFSNWIVGRDGKYSVKLISNSPNNTIDNHDFDTVGTPSIANNEFLENFSNVFPSRLLSSKMLLYNDRLLKDSTAGHAIYLTSGSGGGSNATKCKTGVVIRLPLDGTVEQVYIYAGLYGTIDYLQAVIGTGTKPLVNVYQNLAGVTTLLGTLGTADYALGVSGGAIEFQLDYSLEAGGTQKGTVWVNGTSKGVFTGVGTRLAGTGGGGGIDFGSAGTGLNISRSYYTAFPFGTILEESYKTLPKTKFNNTGNAINSGTGIPSPFDQSIVLAIKTPGGTAGTLAGISYVGTTPVVVTVGTSYYFSLVAALQSGTATNFRLGFTDAGGSTFFGSGVALGTGTWSRPTLVFNPLTSGTGTVFAYVNQGGTSAGTAWIDAVEFYPIKTLNSWQIKNMKAELVSPSNSSVAIRFVGTGEQVMSGNSPLQPMQKDLDARDSFSLLKSQGTISGMVYKGLSQREISSLASTIDDGNLIGSAVLNYYSKPRIRWEADFLDSQEVNINLFDTLYIQSGRFPELPGGKRILVVNSVEDMHDTGGVPHTRIGGEFVFDAIADLTTII